MIYSHHASVLLAKIGDQGKATETSRRLGWLAI